MSLRIKKQLGYGIAHLRVDDDGMINDPRINTLELWKTGRMTVGGYQDFLTNKYKNVNQNSYDFHFNELVDIKNNIFTKKDTETSSLSKLLLILDGDNITQEQGAVVLISPYSMINEWRRNDDYLDYAEHQQKFIDTNTEYSLFSEVNTLQNGPFPYDSSYTNTVTGERVNSETWNMIKALRKKPDTEVIVTRLLHELGFSSFSEAHELIIPTVPTGVIDIAEWTNVFTNKDEAILLKPMIVTYWA